MLLRGPDPKSSAWVAQMLYHISNRPAPLRVGGSDRRHQYPSQKQLRWLAGKAPAREDWCQDEQAQA